MSEDKIKAMWEEDGDLMRLKKFFGYVYQDDGLKERIKDKTRGKILDSVKNQPLENMTFVAAVKKNRLSALVTRIKNKLLYGNKKHLH